MKPIRDLIHALEHLERETMTSIAAMGEDDPISVGVHEAILTTLLAIAECIPVSVLEHTLTYTIDNAPVATRLLGRDNNRADVVQAFLA